MRALDQLNGQVRRRRPGEDLEHRWVEAGTETGTAKRATQLSIFIRMMNLRPIVSSVARIRGLLMLLLLIPGAYAPGFVLPLASQAHLSSSSGTSPSTLKFDFGPGTLAPGYTRVMPQNIYSREAGFGFEPGSQIACINRGGKDPLRGDFCTSDKPFYFSVALPEGNYNVTVTLGDAAGETTTTVKAELRRLTLEQVQTAPGKFATRTFTVNVRTPQIAGGGEVKLKDREKTMEWWAWDEKLTLEFNGARPALCALEITRADNVPTVFLLGDS